MNEFITLTPPGGTFWHVRHTLITSMTQGQRCTSLSIRGSSMPYFVEESVDQIKHKIKAAELSN